MWTTASSAQECRPFSTKLLRAPKWYDELDFLDFCKLSWLIVDNDMMMVDDEIRDLEQWCLLGLGLRRVGS